MLTSLTLRTFRNLADQSWSPTAGRNLIFGLNGAGKSSLLEAVYLVTTTRSFRTSRLEECARLGGSAFHVGADIEGEERVRLEVGQDEQGKRRAVNGKNGPIAEHLAVQRLVSWTHRDLEIFLGPPAVRRRMIDRGMLVEQPATFAAITEYRRALEAKKAALESQAEVLGEWNRLLARTGAELVARRARWIDRLEAELAKVLEESDLGLGAVRLGYRPSPKRALEGEEGMLEALVGLSAAERRRGIALVGPHRDDLDILWRHGPVGRMASAGERKLLGLALVVAQARLVAERGAQPLFLVDDLDAELDPERVDQVWGVLDEAPQLLAASSRKNVVNGLRATAKWRLEDGILVDW